MIFIDGEPWPPSLHGTGTEDYFNTAWCPTQEVCTPYHGIILGGGPNWSGKISLYRYHIEDPIIFKKSIKVTIEHGHNNHRSDVTPVPPYWYQAEPHLPFPKPSQRSVAASDIRPQNQENLKKIFMSLIFQTRLLRSESMGVTIKEVAEHAGVSAATVSRS